MNEWPTRVRTALPPSRSITSGTAARADQVVENGRAGIASQQTLRHQRRHHIAAEQLALFIDHEHAVGVAVEGDTQVARVAPRTARCRSTGVLRFDGAGRVVGEGAVQLEDRAGSSSQGRCCEDARAQSCPPCRCPRRPRSCSGLTLATSMKREHVVDVVVGHIALDDRALRASGVRRIAVRARSRISLHAGLGAEGDGVLAAHLQAVVLLRDCARR